MARKERVRRLASSPKRASELLPSFIFPSASFFVSFLKLFGGSSCSSHKEVYADLFIQLITAATYKEKAHPVVCYYFSSFICSLPSAT